MVGLCKRKVKVSLLFCCCILMVLPASIFAAENLDEAVYEILNTKWTGDYSKMQKTRVIRALVPRSKHFYFLDGPVQRGLAYETLMEFEKFINKKVKAKHKHVHIVIVPTRRDRLIPALAEGLGDIAVGNLTITKQRLKQADFSTPFWDDVSEIVVTGPSSPQLTRLDDLSGKEVHTRKSSSYYGSLLRLNKEFAAKGKPKVKINLVSEYLEDEDLLEMLAAELLEIVVVDDHKAVFWSEVLDKITIHPDIKVNSGGKIGWAFRKSSPELKKVVDAFVTKHKIGTQFGNVMYKRYLQDASFIKSNMKGKDFERFQDTLAIFRKYADKYSFDELMLAALAYQESKIDQSKKSPAGAVGVMQILPSTAKDKNVDIKNIHKIDANIHAGTKYLRFMVDRYFDEPGIDKLNRGLFCFCLLQCRSS